MVHSKRNLLILTWYSRRDFSFQDNPTEFEENAGTVGEAQWQANLSVGYKSDSWSASWKTRYLQDVSLYTSKSLAKNPDPNNITSYGSYFITDVLTTYSFDNGISIDVGVDNLFDRGLPGVTTGTGAGSASYDNLGRFVYTSISFKM